MKVIRLQRYTETGFLIKDIPEPGSDILFDMGCSGNNFEEELIKHGSSTSRVKRIFITHFHGDHYHANIAWELAQKNAVVLWKRKTGKTILMNRCFLI